MYITLLVVWNTTLQQICLCSRIAVVIWAHICHFPAGYATQSIRFRGFKNCCFFYESKMLHVHLTWDSTPIGMTSLLWHQFSQFTWCILQCATFKLLLVLLSAKDFPSFLHSDFELENFMIFIALIVLVWFGSSWVAFKTSRANISWDVQPNQEVSIKIADFAEKTVYQKSNFLDDSPKCATCKLCKLSLPLMCNLHM